MEDFIRISLAPLAIMAFGFLLEGVAIRSRGSRRGLAKFRAWLRRADGSLHSDSPCNLSHIESFVVAGKDKLVDISELASFEDYGGISFDLCIAAITADVVAIFRYQQVELPAYNLVFVVVFHLLLLGVVVALVTANHSAAPVTVRMRHHEEPRAKVRSALGTIYSYPASRRRTVLAALVGLFALVTSFVVLWEAL